MAPIYTYADDLGRPLWTTEPTAEPDRYVSERPDGAWLLVDHRTEQPKPIPEIGRALAELSRSTR